MELQGRLGGFGLRVAPREDDRRVSPLESSLAKRRTSGAGRRRCGAWNCRGDSADLGFGRRPVRMAVESPRWKLPWQNVGHGRGFEELSNT